MVEISNVEFLVAGKAYKAVLGPTSGLREKELLDSSGFSEEETLIFTSTKPYCGKSCAEY